MQSHNDCERSLSGCAQEEVWVSAMFQSAIFLNGTIPELSQAPFLENTTVTFAADGGTLAKLLRHGFSPDYVVGDGDSFAQTRCDCENFDVLIGADQETTDFEKCIKEVHKRNLPPTVVYGIGGGEIDHQHNNLATFAKYSSCQPMLFIDAQPEVPIKLGCAVRSNLTLGIENQSVISLLPFPHATLTTHGLVYALTNDDLSISGRSGARNVTSSTQVSVQVHQGLIIGVFNLKDIRNVIIDGFAFQCRTMPNVR